MAIHTKSQFLRLMDLDQRIRSGKYPSVRDMAKTWEVTPRTIKRDLEFMRDSLLAPISYDPARHGYFYSSSFRFGEKFYMPANS